MNIQLNKELLYGVIGSIFGLALVFILYSMFFADIDESVSLNNQQQVESILPHGNKLDIAAVASHGSKTNRFNYPTVDPSLVGVTDFAGLIRPN